MSSECILAEKNVHLSQEALLKLDEKNIPRHVAIIMDGNRRWAKRQFLSKITSPLSRISDCLMEKMEERFSVDGKGNHKKKKNASAADLPLFKEEGIKSGLSGHFAGADVLSSILEASYEIGIKVLTVFAFSTENWNRSPKEIEVLLRIFESYLKKNRQKMLDQGVKFNIIGDISPFSERFKSEIEKTRQATQACQEIEFVVALNYGGRDEICRAVRRLFAVAQRLDLKSEDISESLLGNYLDTSPFGDPDLLIRTSGEMRISNFMLWQLAYAEIYTTEVLWPDFTPRDLLKAVLAFQKRQRRLGR